jgi:hypothetical protein
MSSATPPPGWHPDPGDPGGGSWRWWDGNQWTGHVRPAAGPGIPAGPGRSRPFVGPPAAGATFFHRNSLSFTALGVAAVYVALAAITHFALIGIVPLLMAIRALRRRETLAPLALLAAIGTIIVSFSVLTSR